MAANWNLVDDRATLNANSLSAAVDCLQPSRGLTAIKIAGKELANFSALQVELPNVSAENASALFECYQRGGDLVSTYAERPAPQMRAQVYWRAGEGHQGALATIELIASVQTNLLDDNPQLSCGASLPSASHALRLAADGSDHFLPVVIANNNPTWFNRSQGPGCFLFRLAHDISYAEMVHPADYETSSLNRSSPTPAAEQLTLRHQLFVRRLEKGVILRSRVLGVFLSSINDEQVVAAAYRHFAASEPPLTT